MRWKRVERRIEEYGLAIGGVDGDADMRASDGGEQRAITAQVGDEEVAVAVARLPVIDGGVRQAGVGCGEAGCLEAGDAVDKPAERPVDRSVNHATPQIDEGAAASAGERIGERMDEIRHDHKRVSRRCWVEYGAAV